MKSFGLRILMALVLVLAIALVPALAPEPVHATLGGAYQTVSYSTSNWGGTAGMSVSGITQNTYRYNVDLNNQMHLMVDLLNGSLSGSFASAFFTVKIPEGRTSVNTVQLPALVATDNGNSGTWQATYCIASAGSGSLICRLASGANFASVTNTFRFDVNTVLEVSDAP